MTNTTKSRAELKSYFETNAIPTQSNFAALIDGQLNQSDDGVFKLANEPLSVVAAGGDQKRVLRLYAQFPATNPDWLISLNPADPSNTATNRPGFGVANGDGKTRLFLDAAGKLGLGTNDPQGAVDVRVGGSTNDWHRFVVTTSAAWGDEAQERVIIGAGGAAGIMFANPHVPWYAQDHRASIRYGRIGGKPNETFWDVGARKDGSFSFNASDNGGVGEALSITKKGDLEVVGTATIQGTATMASATLLDNLTIKNSAKIDATGKLGLGTDNPQGAIDVRIAGSTDPWQRFVVTTSSAWGDNNVNYVTIGAGGATGIMLANPHVPWYAPDSRASIRYGRAGGTANNTFWDVGARTDGSFSFNAADNGGVTGALVVSKDGNLQVHGTATIQGTANLPGGLQFMGEGNGVANHIEKDGALYRFNGQCYLTVDDNLYFRKTNSAVDTFAARLLTTDPVTTAVTLILARGVQLGEWRIEPEGDKLYIRRGNSTVARFSTTQDRFNVFRDVNGTGPYWYYNNAGNFGKTTDSSTPP